MIIYNESQSKFEKLKNGDDLEAFHKCIQEILLWKGENPMDADRGIDYLAVFENRKLLRSEITRVIDKYKDSFNSIEIVSLKRDEGSDVINVYLNFQLPTGKNIKVDLNPTLK